MDDDQNKTKQKKIGAILKCLFSCVTNSMNSHNCLILKICAEFSLL